MKSAREERIETDPQEGIGWASGVRETRGDSVRASREREASSRETRARAATLRVVYMAYNRKKAK